MDDVLLADKFAGALLGTFAGDALGLPVEGADAERIEAMLADFAAMPLQHPMRNLQANLLGLLCGVKITPGTARYSDDTEMTIGVAESLAEVGGFHGPDLAARFAQNFHGWRGYGPGAYGVMLALKKGAAWNEPAGELFGGSGSFGNGAAMRAAPVGLFYHRAEEREERRRVAEAQARITHTHILGTEGAVFQAEAVALACRLDPNEPLDTAAFVQTVREALRPDAEEYHKALNIIEQLLPLDPAPEVVAFRLGDEITAPASVPTALFAFLSRPHSFEEAVRFAVLVGGDADTIGAMCGAIAGAYHGAGAIPAPWLGAMENNEKGRDYVQELAGRLLGAWQKRAGEGSEPASGV